MPDLPETIRAFVAIRLSEPVEGEIAALIDEIRAPHDGIKWVSRPNLHLTLKFLGPAADLRKIAALQARLEEVAASTAPFDLAARGVGGFPSLDLPRVIWAGLEAPELFGLARAVEDAAAQCCFGRERHAFTAHLTIARLNSLHGFGPVRCTLERAREREFGVSRIKSMTLYRSTLTPGGSVYEALRVFTFRQAA